MCARPLKVKQDEHLRLEVIGGGASHTLRTATVQIADRNRWRCL